MSEARINRKKGRPIDADREAESRRNAMKDATPDIEPPWSIKTMKRKKESDDDESVPDSG